MAHAARRRSWANSAAEIKIRKLRPAFLIQTGQIHQGPRKTSQNGIEDRWQMNPYTTTMIRAETALAVPRLAWPPTETPLCDLMCFMGPRPSQGPFMDSCPIENHFTSEKKAAKTNNFCWCSSNSTSYSMPCNNNNIIFAVFYPEPRSSYSSLEIIRSCQFRRFKIRKRKLYRCKSSR